MLKDMIKHTAKASGLTQAKAKAAIGIVLNAAERQGSPFAEQIFTKMPGARTLSATAGDKIGAATGVIARLIEQTPGGRRYVAARMLRDLHDSGLGHKEIGALLPAISGFATQNLGLTDFGHLGDLMGAGEGAVEKVAIAA